jgi:hypothetical protein
MRRITMVALAAALVLTGAACGDDDDSSDATETSDDGASTDDGSTTDDGGDDGATDTAAGLGLVDEDCQFLLSGAFLNPLAAAVPGSNVDVEDATAQLEAIADEAPEEIQDAMATIAEGYATMAEALRDVDLTDPQSLADPEVQQQLDELEDVFDEEYEEAGQAVSEYIAENCSP